MKLSEELKWRGFLNQTTLVDLSDLDDTKITFYHGFDASADSQTIGNLASMMLDRLLIKHGHKAILLAGGATSLIGDPGGKDTERPMQSEEVIRHNVAMAEKQIKAVLGDNDIVQVNNLDWLKDMTILEFLRDVGKYFGMSTLVQRDYIAKRIGEGGDGMSFTEFSYTLLQGYDYLHLFDNYKCTLQVSGSDQWGNIISGVDLVRKVRGEVVHALTMPLIINKATGKKFGKSEEGAVWLDEAKTSVFKFYQFWLNLDDEGVEDYLKIYTLIEEEELKELMEKFESDKASRTAQKYLAFEVTKLVHGEKRAESVKNISEVLFGDKQFSELSDKDVDELAKEIPTVKPQSVLSALAESGVVSSGTEARRLVAEGAISINGIKISEDVDITTSSLVKKGKNTFLLVR
ncbi:tyrosine--tRNA ligase [Candidatus Nomurabacteria bacterium]|nr:tyrosine--tRNA ligase [Candidatus Nomurabacteria bacterium]